jgi:hypothetical protein
MEDASDFVGVVVPLVDRALHIQPNVKDAHMRAYV